jgi:hypothetical protein
MSLAADIAAFQRKLRASIAKFIQEEPSHRAEYERQMASGDATAGREDDLLERLTRRYLIDPLLRDLGWDPDDPSQLLEEARSWAENGDRLYFDYLGMDQCRVPVLLVEAKGYDSAAPHAPYKPETTADEMAGNIAAALAALKASKRSAKVVKEWVEWLSDLVIYVRSIPEPQRTALKRVVITAGRWLVIFSNPQDTFLADGTPKPKTIFCYASLDEIVAGATDIFHALYRPRLIDTLPRTMTLDEALVLIPPARITSVSRGVVLATKMVGTIRSEYPKRSVYPAVVLQTGGRSFAVTDYENPPAEEPKDDLDGFLAQLQVMGERFEAEVLARFGRQDLQRAGIDAFPAPETEDAPNPVLAPVPGSTAAWVATKGRPKPPLVFETGERGAKDEYLVITGKDWFYKRAAPIGSACDLHSFPGALARRVAAKVAHTGDLPTSFTASGQPQHCAHNAIQGLRDDRCLLDRIETHLCCRSCIFHAVCWTTPEDHRRLPCPP